VLLCCQIDELNELFQMIKALVAETHPAVTEIQPVYRDFRSGDVRHSLADIGKAKKLIAYAPEFSVGQGLERSAGWYIQLFQK